MDGTRPRGACADLSPCLPAGSLPGLCGRSAWSRSLPDSPFSSASRNPSAPLPAALQDSGRGSSPANRGCGCPSPSANAKASPAGGWLLECRRSVALLRAVELGLEVGRAAGLGFLGSAGGCAAEAEPGSVLPARLPGPVRLPAPFLRSRADLTPAAQVSAPACPFQRAARFPGPRAGVVGAPSGPLPRRPVHGEARELSLHEALAGCPSPASWTGCSWRGAATARAA